jgi:hypothetical protein
MVRLSVGKLYAAWYYNRVPPGGEPENESKYHEAKKWIRQHGHCGLMASAATFVRPTLPTPITAGRKLGSWVCKLQHQFRA